MPQLTANQLALLLLIFIGGFLAFKASQVQTDTADVSYGSTNGQMTQAAVRFAQTQRTTIMNAVNACGGCAVSYTAANLISAGALDPSYSGTTVTGGTYCLEFRIYNTSYVQGLLTVVGETSPLTQANALIAANNVGQPNTGYISGGSLVYPAGSVPLSNFTGAGACSPGANAFGALITDNQSIGTTNWLCRVTLPGNASCSTMTLALNMDDQNIIGANEIQANMVTTNGNTPIVGDMDANNFNATAAFKGVTLQLTGNSTVGGTEAVTGASTAASYTATGAVSGTTVAATTSVTAVDFFQTSDGRLKRDWQPIRQPCDVLAGIEHQGRFTWSETGLPGIGVEAQSVIAAGLAELVHANPAGRLSVNYSGLIPVVMACLADTRAETRRANERADAAEAQTAALLAGRVLTPVANENRPPLRDAANH